MPPAWAYPMFSAPITITAILVNIILYFHPIRLLFLGDTLPFYSMLLIHPSETLQLLSLFTFTRMLARCFSELWMLLLPSALLSFHFLIAILSLLFSEVLTLTYHPASPFMCNIYQFTGLLWIFTQNHYQLWTPFHTVCNYQSHRVSGPPWEEPLCGLVCSYTKFITSGH